MPAQPARSWDSGEIRLFLDLQAYVEAWCRGNIGDVFERDRVHDEVCERVRRRIDDRSLPRDPHAWLKKVLLHASYRAYRRVGKWPAWIDIESIPGEAAEAMALKAGVQRTAARLDRMLRWLREHLPQILAILDPATRALFEAWLETGSVKAAAAKLGKDPSNCRRAIDRGLERIHATVATRKRPKPNPPPPPS